MKNVPQWIVDSLGQLVALTDDFEGPCEHYPKGYPCRLISIQWTRKTIYVTVSLDPSDETYEENIALDGIAPIRH